jgi:hypothetical protein
MSVPNTIKLQVPVNASCLIISNRSMSLVGDKTSTIGFSGEFHWGTTPEECGTALVVSKAPVSPTPPQAKAGGGASKQHM